MGKVGGRRNFGFGRQIKHPLVKAIWKPKALTGALHEMGICGQ
jgi:hypothetical protein